MKVELPITRKVLTEKYSIKQDMEFFFLSFIEGCEIKVSDKYKEHIFYLKNDKILFQQDNKNKYFYVSFNLIWLVFENKFKLEYFDIQSFIYYILKTHVKLNYYTPAARSEAISSALEKQIKLHYYTPLHNRELDSKELETHIKSDGYTPSNKDE